MLGDFYNWQGSRDFGGGPPLEGGPGIGQFGFGLVFRV